MNMHVAQKENHLPNYR